MNDLKMSDVLQQLHAEYGDRAPTTATSTEALPKGGARILARRAMALQRRLTFPRSTPVWDCRPSSRRHPPETRWAPFERGRSLLENPRLACGMF